MSIPAAGVAGVAGVASGAAAPTTQEAQPKHWVLLAWEGFRLRALTWLLFVLAGSCLAFALFPETFDHWVSGGAPIHPAVDPHFAALVLCGCLAPRLLAQLAYSLINRRAIAQTICLDYPKDVDPQSVERATAAWLYEIKRVSSSQTRAAAFASLWGVVTMVALVGAVTFLLPPLHDPSAPFTKMHNMVAFAVVGAASTRFLLDLARICIRISNDDVSKRMFAETLRTLIQSVIATLALSLISGLASDKFGSETTGLPAVLKSMGLGAAVAIVGPPVFDYIVGKLSEMLGLARPQPATLTPLTTLSGLSPSDIERLGEEGIDSIETLVSTPPPRIFLNTRFSLQRICTWVDQGLLISRLGPTAAAALHARAGIAGALELRQMAADATHGKTALGALKKAMSLDGDPEAELLMQVILLDDAASMLATFRRTPLADTRERPDAPSA